MFSFYVSCSGADALKAVVITVMTPGASSMEASKGMAEAGIQRLHVWLWEHSRQKGDEEFDGWTPPVQPVRRSNKWLPALLKV